MSDKPIWIWIVGGLSMCAGAFGLLGAALGVVHGPSPLSFAPVQLILWLLYVVVSLALLSGGAAFIDLRSWGRKALEFAAWYFTALGLLAVFMAVSALFVKENQVPRMQILATLGGILMWMGFFYGIVWFLRSEKVRSIVKR